MKLVGKQRLVLDLSCRQRDGQYYVVTDRLGPLADCGDAVFLMLPFLFTVYNCACCRLITITASCCCTDGMQ